MSGTSSALSDSHVHLDRYPDDAVAAMLARAAEVGVGRLLTIGVDLPTSKAALDLADRWPPVLAAVGVHPTRLAAAGGSGDAVDALRRLIAAESGGGGRVAAIGEVGLDDAASDPEGQRHFLEQCFDLAAEDGLPLVLHVVGREATHLAALAIARGQPSVRTVAHYFVGDAALAGRYLEAGCWISVGKPVIRPTEAAVREAIMVVPLDRLLLETDTYPLPGRTTEPRDVAEVCAAVAALTGNSYETVASATSASFERFLSG